MNNLPSIHQMHFVRNSSMYLLYYCIVLICISVIVALPLVKINVSVKSSGILRPITERTEVKTASSGIIQQVFFKEGDRVKAGQLLLQINALEIPQKTMLSSNDITRCKAFIHDLSLLTSGATLTNSSIQSLQSSLYQQQAAKFIQQRIAQQAVLDKLQVEWQIDSSLYIDKVISRKELFDKKIENNQQLAGYTAFINEQQATWQKELQQYTLQVESALTTNLQYKEELRFKKIYAPVAGTIQLTGIKYASNTITAGETICIISPDTTLVAECFVSPQDIGMLQKGQEAILQVDAFNHHHFGTVKAQLFHIDNDFTLHNNQPFFKIRCSINQSHLQLKNGFNGLLKKGLTLQARLTVTQRSLWQLLFDSVNDWLAPVVS